MAQVDGDKSLTGLLNQFEMVEINVIGAWAGLVRADVAYNFGRSMRRMPRGDGLKTTVSGEQG